MTIESNCPHCSKTLALPDDCAGKRFKCSDCATVCRTVATAGGLIELLAADSETIAAPTTTPPAAPAAQPDPDASAPCPDCGEPIAAAERFCAGCGSEVTEATKAVVEHEGKKQERVAAGRQRRIKRHEQQRGRQIASAGKVLIVLAVLFSVLGTFVGLRTKRTNATPLAELASYDADESIEIEGEVYTAAELIDALNDEVLIVFATNYILAIIMLGVYFWARKSPLPALLTGFGVYVAVQVLGAAIEPETLLRGLFVKFFVIAAFITGIKAALTQRAIDEGQVDADPGLTRRRSRGAGRSKSA